MTDNKGKTFRSKISDHNKAVSKELMRDKISFTKTLKSIDEAEEVLMGFVTQPEEPSNARIGAMRALLDSKWRKLNKLLPDVKAVEHTGKDGGPIEFVKPKWLDD